MKKNPGVAYSGKVGAKMKPLNGRKKPAVVKKYMFACVDGPLAGYSLCLQDDGATLPIFLKGQSGHYLKGVWHPE